MERNSDSIRVEGSLPSGGGGSGIDSIAHRLFRFSTRSRTKSSTASSKNDKGPLGLTTLYSPPWSNAVADLIFVHGLGGGSRSTWTASKDPSLYWPLEWLPTDKDFEDVRIHSFGYNSNWDKESVLCIHDFANALLCSILDCPAIPADTKVPIVLVAHSMGGLVIKRAFVIAQCNTDFESVATRVRAMFFLATPHYGADLAQLLSRVLSVGGPRPFVNDLHRQSTIIQSLNDEFPRYSKDLRLFSFFETLQMDFKIKKYFVVPRESAVLGYDNERREHLYADHRQVCKYTSKDNPNYRSVRNALAGAIGNIRSQSVSVERRVVADHRRLMDTFLGVQDNPEDDYMSANGRRMNGSCEWLVQKQGFQDWLNSNNPSVYHITGKPGTGKTILSGKVIAHLRGIEAACSFYFFRHQNQEASDIASFLLSMARQMALQDAKVLDSCVELHDRDENISKSNHRTIWRKLFLESILSSKFDCAHYWVVDALDESQEEAELIALLLKVAELARIRIFYTSRNPYKAPQRLGLSNVEIVKDEILEEDSRTDIALYLEAKMDQFPALNERGRRQMVQNILEKSQGCFLWVSLVSEELRNVHTSADVKRILDEVPTDMNDLFARILDQMSASMHGKPLAKAILTWTVCAARPLTTVELSEALALDLQDSVDSVEASIQSSCGHLVYVDAQSVVRMVHLTARDYLLHPKTYSEFVIDEDQGHLRLLLTCLRYLKSDERKPARLGRSSGIARNSESHFARYASDFMYDHLRRLSWTDADLTRILASFFASNNVLTWIEYIAKHSDLSRLIDTGKALSAFLDGVAETNAQDMEGRVVLNSWAIDLVRLVMQFGSNLNAYPASIFNLIAPFCPSASAPRKQFGSIPRGIMVHGVQGAVWGDCLSTISNPDQQYSSIASSKKHFAIGCFSGKIVIFKHLLYHQFATLDHLEPVRLLCFGDQEDILASAGSKVIRVWNISSKSEVWKFDVKQQCMTLIFSDQGRQLIAAMKDDHVKIWNLLDGRMISNVNWTVGLEETTMELYRHPTTAAFSVDAQLVAVIYKGQDILIWDVESNCLYDVYSRESGAGGFAGRPHRTSGVRCLEFGTGANTDLLAAAYMDGELILFDTATGEIKKRGITVFAHILARSPDGTLLATADPSGNIQIYDFETMQLLYRISTVEYSIRGLAFSGDGLHLLDVRGSRSRIWGPTVLVGQRGVSDYISGKPQEIGIEPVEENMMITSIACHESGDSFFCGKEDGSVHLYDAETGRATSILFSHAHGVNINFLQYHPQSRTITSVDTSSRIMIHGLSSQGRTVIVSGVLLDYRAEFAVGQVVFRPDLDRLLICSTKSDELWSITKDGSKMLTRIPYLQVREPYHWANHPTHADQLLLITRTDIHVFDWRSLQRLTSNEGIRLDVQIPHELSPRCAKPIFNNKVLAVMYSEVGRPLSHTRLVLYDIAQLKADSESVAAMTAYEHLCKKAIHLVGLLEGDMNEKLVFLQAGNWVSSVTADSAGCGCINFHFFFPADWMSTVSHLDLMLEVTRRGDVLMVKGGEVAVVRRGLHRVEFQEQGGNALRIPV